MILALLAMAQVAAGPDDMRQVSLEEALRLARVTDPAYVEAEGRVGDAAWARRSAWSEMFLPDLRVQASDTRFSSEFFNVGTGRLADRIVEGRLEASYDLFRGGRKFFELDRTGADLTAARAAARQARFDAEFLAESAYYDVLAAAELVRAVGERVTRAEEQLEIARARVLSGAAVQTDSLQVLLELTRARVDLLRQEAALRVARLELGRRIGHDGPVDALPLGPLPEGELPIDLEQAVREALARGPAYRAAAADERAASAAVKAERGGYLPDVSLFWRWTGFDEGFFPDATTRRIWGFQVSLPIWDNAQRELTVARARTRRDAARAARADVERRVRRDVVEAYENYRTARASTDLAERAVLVARENLRVQGERYRAGATTILDLLTAQVDLTEAEAALVQARHATWLALASLESLLGRRLHDNERSLD